MEALLRLYQAITGNLGDITQIIAHLVLAGSIIIKLTPTLKDDDYWKPIVKFIGKYIALDKFGPPKPSA